MNEIKNKTFVQCRTANSEFLLNFLNKDLINLVKLVSD